jgi:hypothetical protein
MRNQRYWLFARDGSLTSDSSKSGEIGDAKLFPERQVLTMELFSACLEIVDEIVEPRQVKGPVSNCDWDTGIAAKSAKYRVLSPAIIAIISALQKWRELHAARKEYSKSRLSEELALSLRRLLLPRAKRARAPWGR